MRALFVFVMGFALVVPSFLDAQVNRRRSSKSDKTNADYEWDMDEEEEAQEPAGTKISKRKKRRRFSKAEKDEEAESEPEPEVRKPMSSKEEIERHLQARIKTLKEFHKGQMIFGQRMNASWVKFWDKTYADRKLFDVRMARQRLNLFESLASLDVDSHAATVADFDRLQMTQIRAFESDIQKRMSSYLTQMMADLKVFTEDQEKKREEFNRSLIESWSDQKTTRKERRKSNKKKRKKRD